MRIIEIKGRKGTVQQYFKWMRMGIMDDYEVSEFMDALIASLADTGSSRDMDDSSIKAVCAFAGLRLVWRKGRPAIL